MYNWLGNTDRESLIVFLFLQMDFSPFFWSVGAIYTVWARLAEWGLLRLKAM